MTRLFVTSSGTEIGKTFITAELTRLLKAQGKTIRALKPVASGFTMEDFAATDTSVLLQAAGKNPTAAEIDLCSPWRYAAPLSPDRAAAREGKTIDFPELVSWCKAAIAGPEDIVMIEGIGGVMVPIDDRHTVRDWITQVGIPALLVVGSYLGTISHTLTAFEALKVPVRAIIINESEDSPMPVEETAKTISQFVDAKVLPLHRARRHDEWDAVVNFLTI